VDIKAVVDGYLLFILMLDFKKADPSCTLDDAYILPNTRDYRESVFCPHDGIAQVKTGRKLISRDAYEVLLTVFGDGFPVLDEDVEECALCLVKKASVKDERVGGEKGNG
jgi:hypothetical protein